MRVKGRIRSSTIMKLLVSGCMLFCLTHALLFVYLIHSVYLNKGADNKLRDMLDAMTITPGIRANWKNRGNYALTPQKSSLKKRFKLNVSAEKKTILKDLVDSPTDNVQPKINMQKLVAGSHIPPPFYPWHFESNVSEEVIRRDIKFLITQQSAIHQEDSIWPDSPRLYMIHNAKLCAIKRQELFLQQNRSSRYNDREKPFEEMVQHALDLANYLLKSNHDLGASVRTAMEQLVHPETVIPLFLSRGDWRLCSTSAFNHITQDHKMYNLPIFTWAMPSTTTLCTPLALPSYEMWRRLKEESFQKPETLFDPTTSFPWKQKRSKVIWRGSTTGVALDSKGNPSNDLE